MPATAFAVPEPSGSRGIVDIVGEHTALRPLGQTQLQGDCPFCGSTAFRVRPAPYGTFHCFRCGEGGDGHLFLAKIRRDR